METQAYLWETPGDVTVEPGDGAGRPPTNGTPTSNEAAEAIQSLTGRLRWELLDFLRFVGPEGATDEEQQHGTGMNPSTQRPRRGELVKFGLVVDSGRKRPTASGRRATVWVAAL